MRFGLILGVGIAVATQYCVVFAAYTGDGQFTDRGIMASHDRYRVDLGSIDLTRAATHKFRLVGLPDAEMVIGIEIIESEPSRVSESRPKHAANIRMKLETSERQLIVREEGRLETWVRSHALDDVKSFYYRRGEGREIPIGGGVTREERVEEKASRGWGIYFTPNPKARYILTVTVLDVEPTPQRLARLVVAGGGWK